MRLILLTFCLFVTGAFLHAQHTGYTLKFGPSMGIQQWNSFDRGPLFGYHADIQVENISETDARTLYAGLGYHQRGSANRFNYIDFNSGARRQSTTKFVFNNTVLTAGGKQMYLVGNLQGHVSLALRGEVNINIATLNNDVLVSNTSLLATTYPQEEFVNRFLYGIDIGAGLEFPLSPSLDGLLEIRVSPDLSRQYFQPAFIGYNPISGNNDFTYAERKISNVSFELSLGIRFIRYSEY